MTNKQKQCLLFYLGYYTGNIDGKWGNGSKNATKALQEDYGLKVDGIFGDDTAETACKVVGGVITKKTDWWEDIKHFKRDEFKCKCGGKYCNGYPAEMKKAVVQVADRARAHFGAKGIVISGLRCPTHNKNEGGVSGSRHKSGKAIDLRIEGVSSAELLAYVKKQPEIRYAYAINGTNVHFDIN